MSNFSFKRSDRRYFGLWGPQSLCHKLFHSTVILYDSGCVPIKLYLQNSWPTDSAHALECELCDGKVLALGTVKSPVPGTAPSVVSC